MTTTTTTQTTQARVFCCASTACVSSDSVAVKVALQQAFGATLEVRESGCMGLCSRGPMVRVEFPDGTDALYESVTPTVAQHIAATVTHKAPSSQRQRNKRPAASRAVQLWRPAAGRVACRQSQSAIQREKIHR